MIKQGKNTICCDDCKAEIKQTKNIIETKFLKDGIEIRSFRCMSCGVKTLIDVTDQEARFKQMRLRNMQEAQKFIMQTINNDNLEERTQQIISNNNAMDKLLKEIKAAKAELKAKYEGEL